MSDPRPCQRCGAPIEVEGESANTSGACRRCGASTAPPASTRASARRSVVVGFLVLVGFGVAATFLVRMVGLSSKRDLEVSLRQRVELNRRLAKILARVRDVPTARKASLEANRTIRAIAGNLRALRLAKGSDANLGALRDHYRALQVEAERQVLDQTLRVLANSGAWQALAIRPALEELEFEEAALLGKPKAAALALPAGVPAPPGRKPPAWHDAPAPGKAAMPEGPAPRPGAPNHHGLNARPGTGRPG